MNHIELHFIMIIMILNVFFFFLLNVCVLICQNFIYKNYKNLKKIDKYNTIVH